MDVERWSQKNRLGCHVLSWSETALLAGEMSPARQHNSNLINLRRLCLSEMLSFAKLPFFEQGCLATAAKKKNVLFIFTASPLLYVPPRFSNIGPSSQMVWGFGFVSQTCIELCVVVFSVVIFGGGQRQFSGTGDKGEGSVHLSIHLSVNLSFQPSWDRAGAADRGQAWCVQPPHKMLELQKVLAVTWWAGASERLIMLWESDLVASYILQVVVSYSARNGREHEREREGKKSEILGYTMEGRRYLNSCNSCLSEEYWSSLPDAGRIKEYRERARFDSKREKSPLRICRNDLMRLWKSGKSWQVVTNELIASRKDGFEGNRPIHRSACLEQKCH